ncbi:FAD-dependent oxidoreductase [Bordetella avium]|uniref:Monooxygenase n=1 Tax=Bordetella avium (strain 197N) TaxID=360910 RepID=Q2KUC4_BORA1|nr:FAD-dependent oxidoreductase [Bordetella avium]AZY50460.1 FAD-dependent oxidoreductase [Bordetella avium]RIQ55585.1 FAD-dependent oxidoreductase [Bordetella avium]RIQ73918.1 FAD-dependent oxidoreductase [Bordetella avium]CAJ50736.1 putative monooxygenase [Bordetella avium 197N]
MPQGNQAPVVIAGGGPVGLMMAALLARYGIASITIEADAGYCEGSRAICMSRRSLEILAWAGVDRAVVEKGLAWSGGRSYYGNQEVLHFEMPQEPGQRFAPMTNIQQYYIEEYIDQVLRGQSALAQVRWNSRVTGLREDDDGLIVTIDNQGREQELPASWLIACDGGRSTVRELLGLSLQGMQYDGRYVIVDIRQKSQRATERLAWFDPPSNPGSTLLMHRQPDDVWRIDYQISDEEDPAEAVKPENVLPRVRSHLEMIGETQPWEPLWISVYNAKCLTLDRYRHGRVLFAGDAAHLVPIFGVRGLNSGLDDAGNLAWKLAAVLSGQAADSLLDSYSQERVAAARMNISYGAKSTEFMAPPDYGFKLLREATLRLALHDADVRSLINPRQSEPVFYRDSPLNIADGAPQAGAQAAPGMPAPDLRLSGGRYLSEQFGHRFTVLVQGEQTLDPADWPEVTVLQLDAQAEDAALLQERYGQARLYLIRPDGYVLGRWASLDLAGLRSALTPFGIQGLQRPQ